MLGSLFYSTFDYSIIHEGDIIYETSTIFFDIGHNGIVYDIGKASGYGVYIQTLEAVAGGVQYGYLDDSRMVDFGVKILRVTGATEQTIKTVKLFNLAQLNKPYDITHVPVNKSIGSAYWYCSELVYASYLSAGIDICVNENGKSISLTCFPSDIYKGVNTYEIADANFLALSVSGKYKSTWSITIKNTSDHGHIVYYNSKMCFKDDAQQWSNLKNEERIYIPAGESKTIPITENWFATSIAVSYISNGYRLITYADNLSKSNQLKYYYSLVKANNYIE